MKNNECKSRGIDTHHRLAISLVIAAVGAACLFGRVSTPILMLLTWDLFALTELVLAWAQIIFADPLECLRLARLEDSSRSAIFVFVIAGAFASLSSVGYLLLLKKGLPPQELAGHVFLTLATVVFSWTVIHTGFALRYAHIFYANDNHAKKKGERTALIFPNEDAPDYLDFSYFSFVIGMTCQVSDVQISSRRLRRLALVHGLLTFLFNTVIVALSINIVSSLL